MQPTEVQSKRNQIEHTLWRLFSQDNSTAAKPPKPFLTRIKRLLEIDRAQAGVPASPTPHADYAFFDQEPGGHGVDVGYSPFNVFCLAFALDLLDAGFKQSEVVFLMKHAKEPLKPHYTQIMETPPAPTQLISAEDRPIAPTYERNGMMLADPRVFVVIQKVDLTEAFPSANTSKPLIFVPQVCKGIEALKTRLGDLNAADRKALVLEIAEMAVLVTTYLQDAPARKRGRGG